VLPIGGPGDPGVNGRGRDARRAAVVRLTAWQACRQAVLGQESLRGPLVVIKQPWPRGWRGPAPPGLLPDPMTEERPVVETRHLMVTGISLPLE
jgi:hypothetical protein